MKNQFGKIWKFLLLALPLFLGTAGFCAAGERLLDAAFISLCLYGMEYQDPPVNGLVEIARWTAPLAVAGGVLMLFAAFRQYVSNFFRYMGGDSVAVYGPDERIGEVLARLGGRGIRGGETFVRAHRYMLMGDEEENLAFYSKNRESLAGHVTYLWSSSLRAQENADPDVRVVCPEETKARLFWKKHCLYDMSLRRGHQMKLVFVGFGRLGEELLLQGLQNNIFDPEQRIEYHIFGDGDGFLAVHHQMPQIQDPVVFHGGPWHGDIALLEEAQMVVVLSQENQLMLVRDLLLALNRKEFHVFAAEDRGFGLLSGRERLRLFCPEQEEEWFDCVWGDSLFEQAKRINLRYASLYGGAPDTDEAKEAEWRKLDGFTRYSNISSADYHQVQQKMLSVMGQPEEPEKFSMECMELLSELEHIRWCRYHHLNNWRYGVLENGKSKDPERRIHRDLISYDKLTDDEKNKDRENIRILFSVK